MAIQEKQREILEKIVSRHPEIDEESIKAVLNREDGIYFGGMGFFKKMNKDGNLKNILAEGDDNLEGHKEDLFDILFDGNILGIEESLEYPGMLTFVSNISRTLGIFYNPSDNEFYITPHVMKKTYKLVSENKYAETILPEFVEGDLEHFKWWNDKYKILSDNNILAKERTNK